jgi:hypothetical protein
MCALVFCGRASIARAIKNILGALSQICLPRRLIGDLEKSSRDAVASECRGDDRTDASTWQVDRIAAR